MSDKIQLTPGELQAQAGEMLALKDEFELLFNGVTDVLGSVNGSWSPNLANNFAGKIKTAQRSFSQVTEMLENGAKVANKSAESFATVDSELSKIFGGTTTAAQGFKEALIDQIKDIPEDIKTAGELLAWLEKQYGELPDWIKDYIKDACPDSLEEAYKLTSALLQGDLSMEHVYSVIDYVTDGSIKGGVVIETIKHFIENVDKIDAMNQEMTDSITQQLTEGDPFGAVVEFAEGFIDMIGGGSIEVIGGLAGGAVDGVVQNIPFVGAWIKDALGGNTIGDYVSDGFAWVADGVDTITDSLSYGLNYVSDAAISGLKKVGSWIGSWF